MEEKIEVKYEELLAAQLEAELENLYNELDDTEVLRDAVLGQSGNHVSSGYVKKFQRELDMINGKIEHVKMLLNTKE